MTGPPSPATEPSLPQAGRAIGRAAVLIGAITVLARVIGFGRQLVFAHTVGSQCLGTAYATANQVPNIIYDVVLGGALTSVVVPVLAGAAARRARAPAGTGGGPAPARPLPGLGPLPDARVAPDARVLPDARVAPDARVLPDARVAPDARVLPDARVAPDAPAVPGAGAMMDADAEASTIASALLTWTVALLAPVSLGLALAAGPLTSLLLADAPGCDRAAMVTVSARMLAVFAPQILLYGLAVVLYGILQAHQRFTAPALAPVLSSLVVMSAYGAFLPLGHGYQDDVAGLPVPAELMLSAGTTAGVAALVVTVLGPALRLRLRLRPTFRFPAGAAGRVRGLAAVGVVTLIAQDAALVAVIVLANSHQGQGALVLYNYGWQVFFVPYAVLAVPIATSAFPALSAAHGGEAASFNRTAAGSTRAVMLVSWLGAGMLVAAALPLARLFENDPVGARELAFTFAAFAPGLVGYGLAANLSRVLFACRRSRVAAVALVSGWLLVIVADVAAVAAAPARWVVPVLGLGNTAGLTVAALALLAAVRVARGPAALLGAGRAAAAGLAGALAGAGAGAGLSAALPVTGFFPNAGVAVLACLGAAAAFGVVALVVDGRDLRAMAVRAAGRLVR